MERLPREPQIVELLERALNAHVRIKCQYAPRAGMARLALKDVSDEAQSGIYTYNMRTKSGVFSGLSAYVGRNENVLRTALLYELRTAGFDLLQPEGYPEMVDVTQAGLDQSPVGLGALTPGNHYLYAGTDCYSECDFRIFQFDSLAEDVDSSGVPFTSVLYRPNGLLAGLHLVRYNLQDLQPYRYSVYKPSFLVGAHERCAVPMYRDDALPYLTPEHFATMSTEQTFHPLEEQLALSAGHMVQPDWPPV